MSELWFLPISAAEPIGMTSRGEEEDENSRHKLQRGTELLTIHRYK